MQPRAASLDDLLSPEVIRDPHPGLRALREQAPVHWNERWKGWVITSYEVISQAHKNPALSNDKYTPFKRMKTPTPEQEQVFGWLGLWLGSQDPPLHKRLRDAIHTAFTARSSLEALDPIMVAAAEELLDAVADQGGMDLVHDFAYPLTTRTIGALLGMTEDGLLHVQRWADAVAPILFMTPGVKDRYTVAARELDHMGRYFQELLAMRRAEPKEDLITSLGQAVQDGALSEKEAIATCMVVIFGGHETTKDLLANGVLALLKHPEQLDNLRANPEQMGTAVEEILRYDSPAKSTVRWATTDTVLGGQAIKAGERILMFWSAANRDPERFEAGDTLDLARHPNHHLAFGKGIHYCIGAPLARREAILAFNLLLSRCPGMALAVPESTLTWRPTIIMRSLESLPVRWEAE